MTTLTIETTIARHGNQMWGDHPYAVHLEAVSTVADKINRALGGVVPCHEMRDIAYMHDVVEDTATDVVELPVYARSAVALVSRNISQGELTYQQYIEMIAASNDIRAKIAKLADGLTNLTLSTSTGNYRAPRYQKSVATLSATLTFSVAQEAFVTAMMNEVKPFLGIMV
jgi:(p)ppGpp synthase/HD superfamily hydrolase